MLENKKLKKKKKKINNINFEKKINELAIVN